MKRIRNDFAKLKVEVDEETVAKMKVETVKNEVVPIKPVIKRKEMKKLYSSLPEYNLLLPESKKAFMEKIVYPENDVLSPLSPSAISIESLFSDVMFHEEELINYLQTNKYVVQYRCVDKIITDESAPLVKVKASTRGRKKKEKVKKIRQSLGKEREFHSQITFVVRLDPNGEKVYKYKIFRNGVGQVPGLHDNTILDDIFQCIEHIKDALYNGLTRLSQHKLGDAFITLPEIKTLRLFPTMKNFKFSVNLDVGQQLNLMNLKTAFNTYGREILKEISSDIVFEDIKYSREDTSLALKIRTPIYGLPLKTTRLKIFLSNRCNALGTIDDKSTIIIYKMMIGVFSIPKVREAVIVRAGEKGVIL